MSFELIHRRRFIALTGIAAAVPLIAGCGGTAAQAKGKFRISKTDAQWRRELTKAQYYVLREEGTERAFTSPLDKEKRKGTFVCAGCKNRVYSSAHKYNSGTGWPSFYKAIDSGAVGTSVDYKLGYARTEVHCADCGGHLGHIFGDGPEPTGKRHCINGVALKFIPG